MTYYFAPMEGITGYVYRNAHHRVFGHVDKYFTPFLVPNQNRKFSSRELNDVLPEHNEGLAAVPQILTNRADYFIWEAEELKKLGYREVNLNLGCPSGTVVSKRRGSGFLAFPEELDRFLDQIFTELNMEISVKTRLGKNSPDEMYGLMEIFNRYPIKELIIHPRIQTDFYKNTPNKEVFGHALASSKNKVCYNGDIFTSGDYETFTAAYPSVDCVMMGRGLVANPGLAKEICGQGLPDKNQLTEFHDLVLDGYRKTISGDRNILFKMKELWFYMLHLFEDADSYAKKIRKAERLSDYEAATAALIRDREIKKTAGYPVL